MIDQKMMELLKRENTGFNLELGIEFVEIRKDYARTEILIGSKHLNPQGIVHGGCTFSLMDATGGVAALMQGYYVSTASSDIHYLNPAANTQKLIGEANVIKNGKNLLVYDVEARDQDHTLIAKATFTYFRLEKKVWE